MPVSLHYQKRTVMDHQYFTVPKKYIAYTAELFNSEGNVISSTKIIQKNRKDSDMMMEEVGHANRLTSTVSARLMAQIWKTFVTKEHVYELNMN